MSIFNFWFVFLHFDFPSLSTGDWKLATESEFWNYLFALCHSRYTIRNTRDAIRKTNCALLFPAVEGIFTVIPANAGIQNTMSLRGAKRRGNLDLRHSECTEESRFEHLLFGNSYLFRISSFGFRICLSCRVRSFAPTVLDATRWVYLAPSFGRGRLYIFPRPPGGVAFMFSPQNLFWGSRLSI